MQVSSQFGYRTQTHSTFKIMLKTLLFRKAYSLVELDLGFRWGGLHTEHFFFAPCEKLLYLIISNY